MSEDKERDLENQRTTDLGNVISGVIGIYPQDNRLSSILYSSCSGGTFALYLPCGRGLSDVRVVPPSDICGLMATVC
jgi:hypothetical protein